MLVMALLLWLLLGLTSVIVPTSSPTLVIVGRDDGITPLAVAEKMTANIRCAQLVILEKAGHVSNLEQSEGFTDAMRKFLTSL